MQATLEKKSSSLFKGLLRGSKGKSTITSADAQASASEEGAGTPPAAHTTQVSVTEEPVIEVSLHARCAQKFKSGPVLQPSIRMVPVWRRTLPKPSKATRLLKDCHGLASL